MQGVYGSGCLGTGIGVRSDLDISSGIFSGCRPLRQAIPKMKIAGAPWLDVNIRPESADSDVRWHYAQVSAGVASTSAEPTRDTILRVAIQLRRRLQEAKRRLDELGPSLKAQRPVAEDPFAESANVAEIDALFASDSDDDVVDVTPSETDTGKGASSSRAAELPGASKQTMAQVRSTTQGSVQREQREGGGRTGQGGGHVVGGSSGSAGPSGRSTAGDGGGDEVMRPVYKDPAAYKPRVGPAVQSATARLGMATASHPKTAAPAAKVEAPKELPENLKKKLLEQVWAMSDLSIGISLAVCRRRTARTGNIRNMML
jgi:hypothetical protein